MRKRTYTALDGRNGCVSTDLPRVNETISRPVEPERNPKRNPVILGVGSSFAMTGTGPNTSSELNTTVTGEYCSATDKSVGNIPSVQSSVSHGLACKLSEHPPQSETAPVATIHNLVGTCEIQSSITPIDLDRVYRSLANSFYCRRRFAAITIRVTEPVCTGLLFTSGKLVITGCKTLIECVLASLKIVRMLQRHIPSVTFLVRNAVVQNVVAHVVIPLQPGQRLNVDKLYDTWCCNCTFQKNMFPGLIFRPDKSPVVLLLFYSVSPHIRKF
jgi:TATA-box binding protein (TBP) (component of TFIID and TFIIIB)